MPRQNLLLSFCLAIFFLSGCVKQQTLTSHTPVVQDSMVLTPEGYIPRSHIHLIEQGNALFRANGHVYKVRADTKAILEDFGPDSAATTRSAATNFSTAVNRPLTPNEPATKSTSPSSVLPGGLLTVSAPSYITWAQWDIASSANPLTNFNVSWTVPNAPAVSDNQTIFLWDGLEDATGETVMQPVLQWGVNGLGTGGPNWYIACWYVWGNNAAITDVIEVAPGTPLRAAIQMLGSTASGSYSYSLSFYNAASQTPYENGMITYEGYQYEGSAIPFVYEPVAAFIAMEGYNKQGVNGDYGIPTASEYPSGQYGVVFSDILIDELNVGYPAITWSPGTLSNYNGENTLDVSDNTQGQGQVQIDFQGLSKPTIPLINDTSFVGFQGTGTQLCAITGTPGSTVSVKVAATFSFLLPLQLRREVAYTSTFALSTPGITFSGGSSSISVSNSTTTQTFVMPASGYVVGTLTVTGGGQTEPLIKENYVSVSY